MTDEQEAPRTAANPMCADGCGLRVKEPGSLYRRGHHPNSRASGVLRASPEGFRASAPSEPPQPDADGSSPRPWRVGFGMENANKENRQRQWEDERHYITTFDDADPVVVRGGEDSYGIPQGVVKEADAHLIVAAVNVYRAADRTMTDHIDVERLGRAFHEVASHGGPLTPCGYVDPSNPEEYIKIGYNERPGTYDCLCESIASAILARLADSSDRSQGDAE